MQRTPGLLTVVLAAAACAGTIPGRVYDQTGARVGGARVVLLQDFNKIAESKSDVQGDFAFSGVQPGVYQVQVKNPFFGIFQQLVKLDAGAKPFVHAVLHVARADSGLTIGATAPAGTAPTPGVSRAFRAGGRVQGIKRLSGRMPAYPEKAAARGVQGVVVMYGTLRTDGTVDDIVVLESPDHELEEAAVEAWKTWKYEPMKLNGQPVECRELQRFEFQLR